MVEIMNQMTKTQYQHLNTLAGRAYFLACRVRTKDFNGALYNAGRALAILATGGDEYEAAKCYSDAVRCLQMNVWRRELNLKSQVRFN